MNMKHSNIFGRGNEPEKKPKARPGKLAAAALATFLAFAPFAESRARADAPVLLPSSQTAEKYRDDSPSAHNGKMDVTGQPREIHLNHNFDLGGFVLSNEGGSSAGASLQYKRRWLHLGFDAGNMWFGEQAAPFGVLSFRSGVNIWRFKLAYYSRISTVGNMPPWFYSSHMGGAGYSQSFGNTSMWKLRVGAAGGSTLSMPAPEYVYALYSNIAAGASLEHKKYGMFYVMPDFYLAADNPVEGRYIGYYLPRLQAVHAGILGRWWQYTAGVSAMVGSLESTYMLRIARSMNFSQYAAGNIWAGGGVRRWSADLGNRDNAVIMAGITIVMGGKYHNSTVRARYEHLQAGGVRQGVIEAIPYFGPEPEGFVNSGDPKINAQINTAKARILSAASFEEFAKSYNGASTDDLLMTARFLGAFLDQVAFNRNIVDATGKADLFGPEVNKISSTNNDMLFEFVKQYVDWYENHPNQPIPDELKNGITVCAGIHNFIANFLRQNNVPAIVVTGMHAFAVGKFPDSTILFDYETTYSMPPDTFDQLLRFYGQQEKVPIFQVQLFGPDGYMGTYVTPEGRLLHGTIGVNIPAFLMEDFLGVH